MKTIETGNDTMNYRGRDEAEFLKRIPGFTLDDYDIVVAHVKEKWCDLAKGKGDYEAYLNNTYEYCYDDFGDYLKYFLKWWFDGADYGKTEEYLEILKDLKR